MAEDLTPRIVSSHDSAEFRIGGGARETTIVMYTVGRFGPFQHTFDRNPKRHEVEAVMRERKESLEGLV